MKTISETQFLPVKNAGMTAEIIGWIAIILVPPAFLFNRGNIVAIGIWLVYLLLGVWLVLAGRYIEYRRGPAISWLLIVNGLICILMIPGVIPIFGIIQSFAGFNAYKKLNGQPKSIPAFPFYLAGKIALVIWTIAVIVALLYSLSFVA